MIKELVSVLQSNPENIFYNAASEQQIHGLEQDLGIRLPPSYREFLSLTNGALLYQTGVMLGTLDDPAGIQTSIKSVRENNPNLPAGLIPFCLDGDMSCFRIEQDLGEVEAHVVRWNPKLAVVKEVAPNFPAWLSEYISSQF